ncbi:hypothetical protein ACNOYE_27895 [Nannocystaceae bacterium ST9]
MPELDAAVSELLAAYVGELGPALDSLRDWWRALERAHTPEALELRWPAGVASHPRVLAIYRDHHRRFTAHAQRRPEGPPLRFDDDAAWGCPATSELIPIPAERLLVDRLQIEAPELHASMSRLVMPPIGIAPEPRPSFRGLDVIAIEPGQARVFAFEHRHGVERGLDRLLGAGSDLRAGSPRSPTIAEASEFHRLAHHAYVRALEQALLESERAWLRELDVREARGLARDEALAELYLTTPCGPVAHPRVLGVIQAYWVLCEEIDGVLPHHERVGPERVLLAWLADGRHTTWVDVLTAMPYWPIGLDAKGGWI